MNRRTFLKSLVSITSALSLSALGSRIKTAYAAEESKEIFLQTSAVAGFQFYQGEQLWSRFRQGDPLQLLAEPENIYDPQAVKVMWGQEQLGYVPRRENAAIAQMLQRGERFSARISSLTLSPNPWQRLTMDIFLVQG